MAAKKPRTSLIKDAQTILKKNKFCPLTSMIEVAKTAEKDGNLALYSLMCKEITPYVFAKRKAIEHVNAEGDGLPTQVLIQVTESPQPMGLITDTNTDTEH